MKKPQKLFMLPDLADGDKVARKAGEARVLLVTLVMQ